MKLVNVNETKNRKIVDLLKIILHKAEEGGVSEIVMIVSDGNEFYLEHTNSDDLIKLVGEIELLKLSTIDRMNEP